MKVKSKPRVASMPMSLRLPRKLVQEIDAEAIRIQHERPGMTVARADAIRVLLVEALTFRRRAVSA